MQEFMNGARLVFKLECDKCQEDVRELMPSYNTKSEYYGFYLCKSCAEEYRPDLLNQKGFWDHFKVIDPGYERRNRKIDRGGSSHSLDPDCFF